MKIDKQFTLGYVARERERERGLDGVWRQREIRGTGDEGSSTAVVTHTHTQTRIHPHTQIE